MRNGGTPPAHLDKAERAKVFDDEGCKHNGFGDPALYTSNGSPPTPSPRVGKEVDTFDSGRDDFEGGLGVLVLP